MNAAAAPDTTLPSFPVSQGMALRRELLRGIWEEYGWLPSLLYDSERGTLKSTELDLHVLDYVFRLNSIGIAPVTVLTIRRFADELSQETTRFLRLLAHIYGADDARRMLNVKDGRITLPNNAAVFEYRGIADEADSTKTLGKSYIGLRLEELTYLTPSVVGNARKALRAPPGPNGQDVTFIMASTNPWGMYASAWRRHFDIDNNPPVEFETDENGQPCGVRKLNILHERETGRRFLRVCPRLWENPWVTAEYVAELRAEPDESKRAAHLYGVWRTAGGNMLDGVFGEHNLVHPWPPGRISDDWALSLAYDHGTRQAFHCGLWATALANTRCPNGWFYPRGSHVMIAEAHSADPDNPDLAEHPMTVEMIADQITQMCKRFDLVRMLPSGRTVVTVRGVADSAMWNDLGISNVASEFAQYGIRFKRSDKPPLRSRFPVVADLMRHAKADERERDHPAVYIARSCTNAIACFQSLVRNPNDPEVWLSGGKQGSFDHPWDSTCYHIMTRKGGLRVTDMADLI